MPSAKATAGRIFIVALMFIIGLGLIIGGTCYRNVTTKKLRAWTHTNATVVEIAQKEDRDSDGDRQLMYAEVVEYEVDGKKYKSTSDTWSSIRPSVGKSREIAYDPVNPQKCIFVGASNIMVPVILWIMGGVFMLGGVIVAVTYFKKK